MYSKQVLSREIYKISLFNPTIKQIIQFLTHQTFQVLINHLPNLTTNIILQEKMSSILLKP